MLSMKSFRRRKWGRRGAAVADFLVGFLLAAIGHISLALVRVVRHAMVFLQSTALQRFRLRSAAKESSRTPASDRTIAEGSLVDSELQGDAVEALVQLGIPRQAAREKVNDVLTKDGLLPLEQLVPKALAL